MNFYKYFTFLFAALLLCGASAPLSVFFISESVEGGQRITIKNISANNQGDWRIALMGENAAYFRINGQRADFENNNDNFVHLPHSLPVGGEWGFMLTPQGLAAGQHSVELALWTTQGQPQYPFNGTILGRTTLYFMVEEEGAGEEEEVEVKEGSEEEDKEEKEEVDFEEETSPEEIPAATPDEEPTSPVIPEVEIPEYIPGYIPDDVTQPPYQNNSFDSAYYEESPIPQGRVHIPRQERPQVQVQIPAQAVPQPPQAAPPAPDIMITTPVPQEETQFPIPNPPLLAAPAPVLEEGTEEEKDVVAEKEPEYEPAAPSQNVQNPQTDDSSSPKFILTILSFAAFLFSILIFKVLRRKV